MATKTISIMEDSYHLLLRSKINNESFSDVIRRILSQKKDIMEFAGVWKNIEDKETENMKKNIEERDIKETKKILEKYKK